MSDRHDQIDQFLVDPPSLEEIGDAVGMTRQGVHYYLLSSGKLDLFLKNRENVKLREQHALLEQRRLRASRKQLIKSIDRMVLARAVSETMAEQGEPRDSWAFNATLRYALSPATGDWRIAYAFYAAYDGARTTGHEPSLNELCLVSGVSNPSQARELLERAGVKPFHRSLHLSSGALAAIERAYFTPLSASDIAYFIGTTAESVHFHLRELNLVFGLRARKLDDSHPRRLVHRGSLRRASMVYEAADVKRPEFTLEEIAEYAELPAAAADRLLASRQDYEPVIKEALSLLYGAPAKKPYVTPGLRKRLGPAHRA